MTVTDRDGVLWAAIGRGAPRLVSYDPSSGEMDVRQRDGYPGRLRDPFGLRRADPQHLSLVASRR